jgi:hypothetical protein
MAFTFNLEQPDGTPADSLVAARTPVVITLEDLQ